MQEILDLIKKGKSFYPSILLSVLLNVLTIGSAIALMGTSSYLITMAGFHPSIAELQVAIVGVRFFGISRGVFRYLERLVSHAINFRILTKLRVRFFSRFEASFPITNWKVEQGDLVSRVLDDIDSLENLYVRILSPAIAAFFIAILTSLVLGSFLPTLGWILFAGLFSSGFLIPLLTYFAVQKVGASLQRLKGKYRAQLTRTMLGAEEIVVYQQESAVSNLLGRTVNQIQKREDGLDALGEGITLLNFILLQSTFLLTLIAAMQAAQNGGLNPVLIPVSGLMVLASFEATQPLGVAAVQLGKVREAFRRLEQITAGSVETDRETIHLQSPISEIRFEDVSYRYAEDQAAALDQISFAIQKGQKVAIVGPSGSGKSTLLQLVQGFRTPQSGNVWVDDQDLSQVDGNEFRKSLSVAGQAPFLFHRSLRQNLSFGNPAMPDDALQEALAWVSLQTWFEHLPEGLDTILQEAAVNISAGEKQRLAIARAMLKPSSFLILDEPTANLDGETEDDLIQQILVQSVDRGILWVSHRLKYLDQFDEILFLQQGKILERGTEAALIKQEGAYYHYWQLQNEYLI